MRDGDGGEIRMIKGKVRWKGFGRVRREGGRYTAKTD